MGKNALMCSNADSDVIKSYGMNRYAINLVCNW